MQKKQVLFGLLCLCVLVEPKRISKKNLAELATSLGATTLVSLLERVGLDGTIASGGPFTIFAPTNMAFEKLPLYLKKELENNSTLENILLYHVIYGKVKSTSLKNEQIAKSLLDQKRIRINVYDDSPDAPAIVTAQGCKVTVPDKMATNGIIHMIDKVMMPPKSDIVDYLTNEPSFSILVGGIITSELQHALAGVGPFTMFAPDNMAFQRIPKKELQDLLKDKEQLTRILEYHIVAGTMFAAGLTDRHEQTLEGSSVTIQVEDGEVTINKAKIVNPDSAVLNGVIHVIDSVLMPPEKGEHGYSSAPCDKAASFMTIMTLVIARLL